MKNIKPDSYIAQYFHHSEPNSLNSVTESDGGKDTVGFALQSQNCFNDFNR